MPHKGLGVHYSHVHCSSVPVPPREEIVEGDMKHVVACYAGQQRLHVQTKFQQVIFTHSKIQLAHTILG